MQKSGIVTSIFKTPNQKFERVAITLNNTETEDSCTIKQTGSEAISFRQVPNHTNISASTSCSSCGSSCSSCSGCGFAKNENGLFVVNGNKIIALNKSNKNLKIGDIVSIEIDDKKIKQQAFFALLLPIVSSILFATSFLLIFNKELLTVLGFFLGLTIGIMTSLFKRKKLDNLAFPEVI